MMKNYKGIVNRYIKNEKRSVVPIFIAIVLTISLIISVVFITQNIMKNDFDKQKILFGDYDIRLQKINSERLNKIKSHDNIKDYALGRNSEVIVKKVQGENYWNTTLNYISVYAVEKKFLDEYINFNVVDGRLPENKNEIVLNKSVLNLLSKDYGVGSKIEVNIRQLVGKDTYLNSMNAKLFFTETLDLEAIDRDIQESVNKDIKVSDDKKVNYTIVGIIETDLKDELFGNKVIRMLDEDEIADQSGYFEAFTYLKDASKEEELANELGIKYIVPTFAMKDYPFGYPLADVKYPGYDTHEYDSLIQNKIAILIIAIIIGFCFMAVYNTFHASIAKRIKVYGILRAIGATMNQISYLVYFEALILYAIAIPIGLILGYILTKIESYFLINVVGLLSSFTMDINLEIILITLISTFLIVFVAVRSVLRKEGKLTPIEAIMDARGLNRNKKSLGSNILGQSLSETANGKEDEKLIKEVLDYEKSTLKFKIMKKIFGFEGELSHKNITRDVKPHKLTKSTLFIAMSILIFFFLQVVNGNVVAGNIIKTDKWDIELNLNNQEFNDEVISEIENISGVENIYRRSSEKVSLVIPSSMVSDNLRTVLVEKRFERIDTKTDTEAIEAKIITLDEKSIELYDGVDIEALDNGGVLLVNKSTNYIERINRAGTFSFNYLFINSEPTLNYKVSDKLLISEDNSVITKEGLEKYYEDKKPFKEVNIVDIADDDFLYSTFNSTNMKELDVNVKLLTTEKGLKSIWGKNIDNRILIKTTKNLERENLITNIKKICARNNYEMRDTIGDKIEIEKNVKMDLGLNIIFAITIVIMVILNLINTTNASILARRKELAGMRAIGMSNKQERTMIIGELFYISLSVAFGVILSIGILSIANSSANLGAGKLSIWTLLIGEAVIIILLMIVSTLTSLGPLMQAKKFSIVEDLKED